MNSALKPIVFSGIQPTGNLHLGNYLGAVQHIVKLQNTGAYQTYYFIADYHSLTGVMSAAERSEQILITAAELIAAGIDPTKTTLFVQSHVPEHTELAWIFSTVTPVAELYRMTQFKDKSAHQEKNINAGLLTYPILQAADILLYHGTLVPVGKDQAQHVELTNDVARWFNKRYGEYFATVKSFFTEIPKVMSLLEPEKKMSKSLGAGHVIELADEPTTIEAKLKKAVTSTVGGGQAPGAENLLLLLKQFASAETYQEFAQAEKAKTIKYSKLKDALAKALSDYFSDFRAKRNALLRDPTKLDAILAEGAEKSRAVASKTITDVRKLIGIR